MGDFMSFSTLLVYAITVALCVRFSQRYWPLPTNLLVGMAALMCAVPVLRVPGLDTPLLALDLLVPFAVVLVLTEPPKRHTTVVLIALGALVVWPMMGILVGAVTSDDGSAWVGVLYHRVALFVFLLAGLTLGVRFRPRTALDAVLLVWIGMCVAGLAQVVDHLLLDVMRGVGEGPGGEHLLVNGLIPGLFGMNRGTTGVLAAAMLSYSATMFAGGARGGASRWVYAAGVALSASAIVAVGSRTAVLAAAVAVAYAGVVLVALGVLTWTRVRGSLRYTLAAVAAFVLVLLPIVVSFAGRLTGARLSDAFGLRYGVQEKVVVHAFSHLKAAAIGEGFTSSGLFRSILGASLSHPHSEYLETLWAAGFVGLVLYVTLVVYLLVRVSAGDGADVATRVEYLAVRSTMISSLVMATTVGGFLTPAGRLVTYGAVMLFVYGVALANARSAQPSRDLGSWRTSR